jgi:AsmA protein
MRWVIRSVLTLCLLVFLGVAALFLVPTERIARLATDRFDSITGRTLRIEGTVRPTIWPTLGVRTGKIAISNADWSDEPQMLTAEALDIGIDMAALWGGDVRVTGLRAIRPRIVLERAADGRENWVFGGANGGMAAPGMAGEGTPFTLDLAEVTGAEVLFIDHGAGQRLAASDIDATLRVPAFTGPAQMALTARMNGTPLSLEATIAEFAGFLEGSAVGMKLALTSGAAELSFDGRAGHAPLAAKGRLNADLADMAAIAALAGITRPALPQGFGARSVALAGDVTMTAAQTLHLRGGRLGLDGNALQVDADLTFSGARPALSAQVSAGQLDFSGVSGGQGGGVSGGAKAEGWPREAIDVSGLSALDATVALSAEGVNLGMLRLGPTRAKLSLDRGRAVFDLREVAAYGGAISGQFVVNGRGGLSVGGDLKLQGLSMQPLLTDLGGYDRLIGQGDLALKFLAVGNSVDALMRSLSGNGSIALGKGELRGLDVAGMLRNLDPGYVGEGQKTIFDAASASFSIDKGVLSNEDLSLGAPYLTARGSGRIDLGQRLLDYRLRPTALAAADGTGGIMVPLLITGTWAAPKFRLDMEGIARERLEAEAKELEARARAEAKEAEARAKAELERRATEELGITQQEGESLEDAARRRAQEALEAEATRALGRLLGGN